MAEQFIGYIEADTGRAILFHDHFWDDPEWLPKSQVEIFKQEGTHELVVRASDWICGKSGLREFERREAEGED